MALASRPNTWFALAVVCSIVTSSCSNDPPAADFEIAATAASDPGVSSGEGVLAAPAAVWSSGRAEQAHHLGADGLVVVSTTGIHVVGDDGVDSQKIAEFTGPGDPGPSAVTHGGARLVTSTRAPGSIVVYDLTTGTVIERHDIDADVREIIDREDRPPVLVTSAGLQLLPDDASSSDGLTMLSPGEIGTTASAGSRLIAPRRGTSEIDIVEDVRVESMHLELPPDASVLDAHAAPDGTVVAVSQGVGDNDLDREDTVVVYDVGPWVERRSLELGRPLDRSEWALTDRSIVVGGADGLTLTAIDDGATTLLPSPVDSPIQSIITTADGIITVHRTGALVVWDESDGNASVLADGGMTLLDVEFDRRTGELVTVDFDGGITTWNVSTGARRVESRFGTGEATGVAFDADGERVAVSTTTGRVAVLDADLEPISEFAAAAPSTRVDAVRFNPVTGEIVTALAERLGDTAFDDTVAIWNDDLATPRSTIGGESEDVAGCAFFYNRIRFTTDGALMSTVSHDFSLSIHDRDGRLIQQFPAFDSTILDAAFSPDGGLIAASTDAASVAVWNTGDFSIVAEYRGPQGGLFAMAFLADGRTVVASDLLGRVVLIDIISGEELMVLTEEAAAGAPLDVSPDGTLVAASLRGTDVGIWSTSGGPRLATLEGHRGRVGAVTFSPDGTSVATASDDGTARTWTIERG